MGKRVLAVSQADTCVFVDSVGIGSLPSVPIVTLEMHSRCGRWLSVEMTPAQTRSLIAALGAELAPELPQSKPEGT